jgi:hypothetical protein
MHQVRSAAKGDPVKFAIALGMMKILVPIVPPTTSAMD